MADRIEFAHGRWAVAPELGGEFGQVAIDCRRLRHRSTIDGCARWRSPSIRFDDGDVDRSECCIDIATDNGCPRLKEACSKRV